MTFLWFRLLDRIAQAFTNTHMLLLLLLYNQCHHTRSHNMSIFDTFHSTYITEPTHINITKTQIITQNAESERALRFVWYMRDKNTVMLLLGK